MSFKEVNNLRKSGQLTEAIAMARTDIDNSRDHWSCSALFWCLSDLNKQTSAITHRQEKEKILKEMQDLSEGITDEQGYVERAIDYAKRSLLPHGEDLKVAEEQAKDGKALDSYRTVSAFFEAKELDESQYASFGWIIYRALHQNTQMPTIERKRMLNHYLQLQLPTPSTLHSCILSEAMSTEKINPNEFMFTKFIELWDLHNLRDDDWKTGTTIDGNRYPSLVERMITLYVREIQAVTSILPTPLFMETVDKAIQKYPENENIMRNKAIACIRLNKQQEAIDLYKSIVLKAPAKFYLWSELTELVENPKLKISLLCKALKVKVSDEFLGKTHTELANQLIQTNQNSWALAELNHYKAIYEKSGWKLSSQYYNLLQMIPEGTMAQNQNYSTHFAEANAFIYSQLPSCTLIKLSDHTETIKKPAHKPQKVQRWILIGKDGQTHPIKPRQFSLSNLPNGQCFEAKISDNRIRFLKPIDIPEEDWIKRVSDNLRIKSNAQGKHFGFVDNCYVHAKLIQDFTDGERINATAFKRNDKWQVIALHKTKQF